MNYRQCKLTRQQDGMTFEQTSWLPAKFAVLGEKVRLKDSEGNWSGGWLIEFVSSESVSEEYVTTARHAHTRQRQASDI